MEEKMALVSGRKQVSVQLVSIAKLFLVACVSGAGSVVLGVWFDSILFSVLMPVLFMCLYIFFALRQQSELPISVIGDSFYYLGFILTLVALVASLYFLAMNQSVNMNNVVGSFGVALITTIIGLIARLVVTSFSVQAKERREHLENEIERSLTTFSEHLDGLTTGVVASIAKVHAETEGTLRETIKRHDAFHNEVLESYKASMASAEEEVQRSIKQLSARIDAIVVEPDVLSKPLVASIEQITNALDQHQHRYAEVNSNLAASNNALSGQFEKSSTVVQEHVNRLEESLARAIESQAGLYQRRLSEIGDAILQSFGDIKDLKIEAQDDVKNKLSALASEIESLTEGIRNIVTPIEKASLQIGRGSEGIADGVDKLDESTAKITELTEAVHKGVSTIPDVKSDLEKLASSINEVTSKLKDVSDTSQKANEAISAAASATESSSVQVAKDISEVYGQLAVQIRTLKGGG